VDVRHLTTHVLPLDEAPKAFDMILGRAEPFLGVLIEYDASKQHEPRRLDVGRASRKAISGVLPVGFIGAGSYAQSFLLPNLPRDRVDLRTVVTASATSARSVAERYGFAHCSGRPEDVIGDPDIAAVFIATRHDSHGRYVVDALRAGKHVFVEKPLCLDRDELAAIEELTAQPGAPVLMVGYNRRFSPLTQQLKQAMGEGPFSMLYRVNAGAIPASSWAQDREIGGGRILGEVCHFVDYLSHLAGGPPTRVFATALRDALGLDDNVSVSLDFPSGGVGTVHYFANGSKALPKEYVEVYGHGVTAVLDDYRELTVYGRGKPKKTRLLTQDKGQKDEVIAFVTAAGGGPAPILLEQILGTSRATFAVLDSLQEGVAISP
jgi:predicted dehydrogenase